MASPVSLRFGVSASGTSGENHLGGLAARTRSITSAEFLGKQVPLEATLFDKDELVDLITAAGFEVTTATVRAPYEFESQTPRLYVGATAG